MTAALQDAGYSLQTDYYMAAAYDSPFRLLNRHNEVRCACMCVAACGRRVCACGHHRVWRHLAGLTAGHGGADALPCCVHAGVDPGGERAVAILVQLGHHSCSRQGAGVEGHEPCLHSSSSGGQRCSRRMRSGAAAAAVCACVRLPMRKALQASDQATDPLLTRRRRQATSVQKVQQLRWPAHKSNAHVHDTYFSFDGTRLSEQVVRRSLSAAAPSSARAYRDTANRDPIRRSLFDCSHVSARLQALRGGTWWWQGPFHNCPGLDDYCCCASCLGT